MREALGKTHTRTGASLDEGVSTDLACQHFANRKTDGLLYPLWCTMLMEKAVRERHGGGEGPWAARE